MSELNDPRVFFAAERTLLAWNRTGLTLMAFGFVIERFGLFVHMLLPRHGQTLQRGISFWIGIGFIVLGASVIAASVIQYRKVLRTLRPVEIPQGHWVNMGVMTNLAVALLAIILILYLFSGPALAFQPPQG
jgi:putative membrane protein